MCIVGDLRVYAERLRPDSAGSWAAPLLAADFALPGMLSRRAEGLQSPSMADTLSCEGPTDSSKEVGD